MWFLECSSRWELKTKQLLSKLEINFIFGFPSAVSSTGPLIVPKTFSKERQFSYLVYTSCLHYKRDTWEIAEVLPRSSLSVCVCVCNGEEMQLTQTILLVFILKVLWKHHFWICIGKSNSQNKKYWALLHCSEEIGNDAINVFIVLWINKANVPGQAAQARLKSVWIRTDIMTFTAYNCFSMWSFY